MGMTLRTSEKQTEALRRQALAEGRSMQAVALSAIDEYIERRAHQTEVNAVLGWRGPPVRCFLASTASGWRPVRTTGST
jgi:hypothetical protein